MASLYGIVAFADVPLVFMAIRWWRTIHPLIFEGSKTNLEPRMLAALIISVVAFSSLYLHLLRLRLATGRLHERLLDLKERTRGGGF